jgi:hypothetical protein
MVTSVSSSCRISSARWPTSWKRSRSKWLSLQRGWCAPPHLTSIFLPACSCGCNLRPRRSSMLPCGPPFWLLASSPTAWWGLLLVRGKKMPPPSWETVKESGTQDGGWGWDGPECPPFVCMDVSLALSSGLYAGIKFFLIDFIFKRCPRLRAKYDTPYIIWRSLPTDPQLKERAGATVSRRVSPLQPPPP